MAYAPTPPMEGAARNFYVPSTDVVDVEKMRAESLEYSIGDSRAKPQNVVLHHHKHGVSCEGHEHENFPAKED